MDRIALEWAGAGTVATAIGMFDVRFGLLAAGCWLIWFANFGGTEEDADTDELREPPSHPWLEPGDRE